ncbi:MAG: cob(I)yrinic acid a,c-diamide adenosyltransferase [Bacteroidetes bacterium]|nr:cob(I)yrinic acid a,c-diamide adenosyltransferase [Bacteroidota bacterium]
MKIYTKTGDSGETGLYGGTRLSKSDLRLEAYGTLDELNSYLGLIRSLQIASKQQHLIIDIQTELFTIGAHLAAVPDKNSLPLPEFNEALVTELEKAIDEMNNPLPEMKHFVLPGGNLIISHIHVCRAVCRRTERRIVQLNMQGHLHPHILKLLNRLSDYLFILARKTGFDSKVAESPWIPVKK